MHSDHFFDWKGFNFAILLVLACGSLGILGHVGLYLLTGQHADRVDSIPSTSAATRSAILAVGSAPWSFSTTTSERVISGLTIAGAVPQSGKFIAADLESMNLTLYKDGAPVTSYPIRTVGKPGTPYETPAGFYAVLTKESDHFNRRERVHMPFSMQFYGNYFIHGWPYYTDGSPVASSYSGGCIRLSTADAEKVFRFAEKNTGIFVYDPIRSQNLPPVILGALPKPSVSAASYLVADVDTGDVYLERNAEVQRPIASLTKLMTALVANETIMFNEDITVTRGDLMHATATSPSKKETLQVGDLLYPLLMESDNAIADRLAAFHGETGFIDAMNAEAQALDMQSTHFSEPSGVTAENVSTPDDLYRLAAYLADKKSFIWDISRTPSKTIVADSGTAYQYDNFNLFSGSSDFIGGKVGKTTAAEDTMTSLFTIPVNGVSRRVAIIILKSGDYYADTSKLADWFSQSSVKGVALSRTACVSCLTAPQYRKILR